MLGLSPSGWCGMPIPPCTPSTFTALRIGLFCCELFMYETSALAFGVGSVVVDIMHMPCSIWESTKTNWE